jgi:hypothetical protein
MATIKDLEKYIGYDFSSGPYTGKDYLSFQTKYINYLRGICKTNGWELAKVSKNHYCLSAFIKDERSNYVYLSISDVRFFPNKWYSNVLVRTAKHDKDYTGGNNNYTSLPGLQGFVKYLLTRRAA